MTYFGNCHTPDELQREYRTQCKRLHPDKGGDKVAFQEMQDEYERAKDGIKYQTKFAYMPEVYSESQAYEYFRRPVKYAGTISGHYYKFVQDFGADILIDRNHTHLIFAKHRMI